MKRIGIAMTDPEDWTARALCSAVVRSGGEPFMFRLHDVTSKLEDDVKYYAGELNLQSLDGIIVRDVGAGGGEGLSYRFDVLCNMEESGILIINTPLSIQRAANKHMTSYLLKKKRLPIPDTILTADLDEAIDTIRSWRRAVLKPIFGYKGNDIHCITDDEKSMRLLKSIMSKRGVVYLQQFIHNPGRDIRAFVVDGRVVGAIYRNAPEGSWISNLSKGGRPEPCHVTGRIEELGCAAAYAVGTVFAGVDLIEGENGLNILEVNATPSGKGIFEACGVDVTVEIVEALKRISQ